MLLVYEGCKEYEKQLCLVHPYLFFQYGLSHRNKVLLAQKFTPNFLRPMDLTYRSHGHIGQDLLYRFEVLCLSKSAI